VAIACSGSDKVREAALQALGCFGCARPASLLEPKAQSALRAALQPAAPRPLKLRALATLADLLKVCCSAPPFPLPCVQGCEWGCHAAATADKTPLGMHFACAC
jgi:hypothetical protein